MFDTTPSWLRSLHPGMVEAYQFECGAGDCVFLIRAANKEEVVEQVQRHATEEHDREPAPVERIEERMSVLDVDPDA